MIILSTKKYFRERTLRETYSESYRNSTGYYTKIYNYYPSLHDDNRASWQILILLSLYPPSYSNIMYIHIYISAVIHTIIFQDYGDPTPRVLGILCIPRTVDTYRRVRHIISSRWIYIV